MKLGSSFISLGDGTLPASFEGLKSHVDIKWIDFALAQSGVATIRHRKLPAEQVVWLVVGMALYRDRPISEVVKRLNLILPGKNGKRRGITNGAVIEARNKVGSDPVERLFHTTAQQWALESAQRNTWSGLKVLGVDGTMMRVPDTAVNRAEFGLPASSEGHKSAGYPQVRAAGMMVLRSHLLLDFAFTGCDKCESAVAVPLIERMPDRSVVILDRYFVNYLLWHRISTEGEERYWLVRGRRDLNYKVVKKIGRGDCLAELEYPRALRVKHPELGRTFIARVIQYSRKGFRKRILFTSLLDSSLYPACEISGLYHERWELELGYDEIKTEILERMEAIRSEAPERVKQEIWGLVTAYNLVRREMEAAAMELGLPPQRLSFRMSLRLIRDLFMWAAVASPGTLPKMLKDLRIEMKDLILPPRRSMRRYKRHVKIKMSGYARNAEHRP